MRAPLLPVLLLLLAPAALAEHVVLEPAVAATISSGEPGSLLYGSVLCEGNVTCMVVAQFAYGQSLKEPVLAVEADANVRVYPLKGVPARLDWSTTYPLIDFSRSVEVQGGTADLSGLFAPSQLIGIALALEGEGTAEATGITLSADAESESCEVSGAAWSSDSIELGDYVSLHARVRGCEGSTAAIEVYQDNMLLDYFINRFDVPVEDGGVSLLLDTGRERFIAGSSRLYFTVTAGDVKTRSGTIEVRSLGYQDVIRSIESDSPYASHKKVMTLARRNPNMASSLCDSFSEAYQQDLCQSEVARISRNRKFCGLIGSDGRKDLCYAERMMSDGDSYSCTFIGDASLSNACFAMGLIQMVMNYAHGAETVKELNITQELFGAEPPKSRDSLALAIFAVLAIGAIVLIRWMWVARRG